MNNQLVLELLKDRLHDLVITCETNEQAETCRQAIKIVDDHLALHAILTEKNKTIENFAEWQRRVLKVRKLETTCTPQI